MDRKVANVQRIDKKQNEIIGGVEDFGFCLGVLHFTTTNSQFISSKEETTQKLPHGQHEEFRIRTTLIKKKTSQN